jgi:hypothetical protein
VNAGGYSKARPQSRLREAVNARLEEISFRTGLITATIGLIALGAIAAAGVFAATLSMGSHVIAATGAVGPVSAAKATPTVTASALPTTTLPATHHRASSTPQATHPVTAATVSPQSPAGSQPLPQAESSPASPRYSGQPGYGHGSSYSGSRYLGPGWWYTRNWTGHGSPGFPSRGFAFPAPRRP